MKKLSIVFPAYNEEKNIINTLKNFSSVFPDSELIVACNGCTDNTPILASSIPNVKVIEFPEKNKGYAVIEALKRAKGDIIGFVDADGSFLAEDIKVLIDQLKNTDVAIASKWKDQNFSDVRSGFMRKIGSRGWNFLSSKLFGLDFKDTQAGAKFFKKNVFDSIDKNFVSSGFGFDIELLYKIHKKGFDIKEIFVPITKKSDTSFNILKESPKMFFSLLKLRFKTLFEKEK